MIRIQLIDEMQKNDINIENESFLLYGKMIPSYNGKWSYTTELLPEEEHTLMTFPDENYSYDELAKNSFFVGAYDEDNQCIGLAIYQKSWNKYLYLYDLKVKSSHKKSGIGKALIEKGKEIAVTNGYNGIYTQGQDNNLSACLFYVKTGFKIGGFDTMLYSGTKQEGKSDVIFYLDC